MLRRVLPLALLLVGCERTATLPGTPLGTFQVSAAIVENTCGELGAPDPWSFRAELAREENVLHWRQEGRKISGTMIDPSRAKITEVQLGQTGAQGRCVMERSDTLQLDLPAQDPPEGFLGSLTFAFAVEDAGACADLMASQGGAYAALPCQIRYDLAGSRVTGE